MEHSPHVRYEVRVRESLSQNLRVSRFFNLMLLWTGAVIFGLLGIFIAWVTFATEPESREWMESGVACLVLFSLSAFGIFAARMRRSILAGPLESGVHFTVTDKTVEFPKIGRIRDAESWPLEQTHISYKRGRFGTLILECPGHRRRTYGQALLRDPIEEVYVAITAQIERAQTI
ncbi:hypothetical protein [Brevibacterium sp. ACRRH]|nr:hypothetical protein [Brevibacterium sp. ACRRH]MCG7298292.1 hypothetical protein [Brevibacterium sp. ACRRH]